MGLSPNIQNLELGINKVRNFDKLKVKQYDKNLRELRFIFIEDSEVITIPSGYTAKVQVTLPNQEPFLDDCEPITDGMTVVYKPSDLFTSVAGTVIAEIGFYKSGETSADDGLLQSCTFEVEVEKSAMDRNAVISSPQFNTLTIMINTLTGALTTFDEKVIEVNDIISQAESAIQDIAETDQTVSENEIVRIANENQRIADDALRIDWISEYEGDPLTQEIYETIPVEEREDPMNFFLLNDDTEEIDYITQLVEDTVAANEASNSLLINKAGINDGTATLTEAYSGSKTQGLVNGINSSLSTVTSQLAQKAKQVDLNTEIQKRVAAISTANARIDSFTSLVAGSTTGDAELIDGRVDSEGTVHTNIGGSIRKQVGKINKEIDSLYSEITTGLLDDFEFESGTIDASNNYIANTARVRNRNYYNYSSYKTYALIVPSGLMISVYYYDGNKAITSTIAFTTGIILIDTAKNYFRMVAKKSNESAINPSDLSSITVMKVQKTCQVIDNNQEKIADALSTNNENYRYGYIDNYDYGAIDGTGINSTSTNRIRSGFLDYSTYDSIIVIFPSKLKVYAYYYDTNGVFISRDTTWNTKQFVANTKNKKLRLVIAKADDTYVSILDVPKVKILMKKETNKTETINYTLVQKAMDGGGVYVDNSVSVAVEGKIATIIGDRYRFTVNNGYVFVINKNGVNYKYATNMLEVIADTTLYGLVIQKEDKTNLSISERDVIGLKIEHVLIRNSSGTYDCIVAANDSSDDDKALADLICDGINDEVEIECAINCNVTVSNSVRVLLMPGKYNIDRFRTIANQNNYLDAKGNIAILTHQSMVSGGRYEVVLEGRYPAHLSKNSATKIIVSSGCHNSLLNDKTKEYTIFGALRNNSADVAGSIFDMFAIKVSNIFISPNGLDKPIICIDGVGYGQLMVSHCGMSWNIDNTSDLLVYFDTNPPVEGLIGIRGCYGSNRGCKNYIKNTTIIGMYEGIALTGEHFIIEDCLEHHCYYGFTIGNHNVRTEMEHPNIFIGNSVEQCYRMGLLNRYGATVETEVSSGQQTLIYIGGSTETSWINSVGNFEIMLPIKEIVKGSYRGRFESDYRGIGISIFETDNSGKNMVATVY